jgi:hypothetical protein
MAGDGGQGYGCPACACPNSREATEAGGVDWWASRGKDGRRQQVRQIRPCYRNPMKVLDGYRVLDPRPRTSGRRRRSAAQRVQGFLFCGVGGLICVSVRLRRKRNLIESAIPKPMMLDCAKCRVEGVHCVHTHPSRIGSGFSPKVEIQYQRRLGSIHYSVTG